jgi:hypothetical protein
MYALYVALRRGNVSARRVGEGQLGTSRIPRRNRPKMRNGALFLALPLLISVRQWSPVARSTLRVHGRLLWAGCNLVHLVHFRTCRVHRVALTMGSIVRYRACTHYSHSPWVVYDALVWNLEDCGQ